MAATDTWTGATDANWADANWTGQASGNVPASGDSLVFTSGTGVASTILTDNLMTPATYTIGGITFSAGASAFVINSGTAGVNGFTLTGGINNSSTSLETINDAIVTGTVAHTVTLTAGGGNITLGGAISGSAGLTTSGSGTLTLSGPVSYTGVTTVGLNTELTFGASNIFTSGSNSLTLTGGATGGLTNVVDLAGFSETMGVLTSGTYVNAEGIITSSVAGGSLTLNEGAANGTPFATTEFTGSLALTIRGNNDNNLQMLNTNSNFSGGLTIQSTGAPLSFANLAVAGGLTGNATEGVRFTSQSEIGTGLVTLDNGQFFGITGATAISNNILVTTNGGVIHNENNGAVYSGSLASSGSTLLVFNSNSGGSHVIDFTGSDSGFSGTWAFDTTNIGGINLNGSAVGNSNTDILWYGDGTNGGKGQLQLTGTASATYTFGELNNYSTIASGTFSGLVENVSASSTTTLTLGDTNATAASYDGLIENGTGILALTKNNTNTQTLAAAETYTGATTVNGGVLQIASNGSLAAGSTVTINSGGTLSANGTVAGAVNVSGGGFLAGTGTVSGLVTLASGSTNPTAGAISLVNGVGTLTLSNTNGLTLGGAAGSYSILDLGANSSAADQIALGANALTVNAGGADITITSLGIASGQIYNLLTYGSGTGTGFATGSGTTVGNLTLTDPSLGFGVTGVLDVTGTAVQLVTSGAAAPSTAYWSGTAGAMWSGTNSGGGNFTTDAAGLNRVQAYPGANTAVIFAASNAKNFTETLGVSFDIGSLTFTGSNAVTINADGNTLSIESGGLTVQSGAGAVSIGANIAGAGGVTNAGTLSLSGANSYAGGTVTSGTLTLGSSTALGSSSGTLAVNAGLVDLDGNSVSVGALSGSSGAVITNNSSSVNTTLTAGGAGLSTTYAGALMNGANGKTFALTKSGTGTLTLTGNNGYSGATLVTGGILQLGNGSALGTSAVTVDSSATLDLDGQTISNGLVVTGSGFGGGGVLINSSTNSAAEVLGNIPNASFTVGGAGTISLTQLNQADSGAAYTVTVIGPGTVNFAGTTLNYLMALTVDGGTVVLAKTPGTSADWAIDRSAIINSGTLRIGLSGTQIGLSSGVTTNGGVFDLGGFNTSLNVLSGTGGFVTNSGTTLATLTLGTTQSGTVVSSGTYSGTLQDGAAQLALVKTGTDTLTLSGDNTYSGGTTVNQGTLQTATTTALGSPSASLTVNSGTLDMDGNGLTIGGLAGTSTNGLITSSVAGSPVLTVSGSSDTSFEGSIQNGSGTLALVRAGTGTLDLTGSSSYSGGTTLNAGTLQLGNAYALGTGPLTINGGALDSSVAGLVNIGDNPQAWNGSFAFNGTQSLNLGNGAVTLSASNVTVTVNASTLEVDGTIGDGGAGYGLTVAGAGTLDLTASNTFSGGLTVNSGTVSRAGGSGNEFGNGNITVNGGSLDIAGGTNYPLLNLSGTGGQITSSSNPAGSSIDLVNTIATVYSGDINANIGAGVTVAEGIIELAGSNSYLGGTTINSGTLQINSDSSLGDPSGGVTLGNGTKLDLLPGNSVSTSRSFSISGTGTVQVDLGSAYSIAGTVTDGTAPGTLDKSGSGTLTLTSAGTMTNSGGLNVNRGTMIVEGSITGAGQTTVNSGATLGGGGTIDGPVTIAPGGTLFPGTGLGVGGTFLTINNNLTLDGTADITLNIDKTDGADYLLIGGNLTLDPSRTDTLTLDVLNNIGASPTTYVIAEYGVNSGLESGSFGSIVVNGAFLKSINYNYQSDGEIAVTLSSVPEPGTWAMTLSGLGMLIAFWRGRRRGN